MTIIKALVTILNILMIVVLISCIVEKTWKQDRATLIGFGFMIVLYVANSALIWASRQGASAKDGASPAAFGIMQIAIP